MCRSLGWQPIFFSILFEYSQYYWYIFKIWGYFTMSQCFERRCQWQLEELFPVHFIYNITYHYQTMHALGTKQSELLSEWHRRTSFSNHFDFGTKSCNALHMLRFDGVFVERLRMICQLRSPFSCFQSDLYKFSLLAIETRFTKLTFCRQTRKTFSFVWSFLSPKFMKNTNFA